MKTSAVLLALLVCLGSGCVEEPSVDAKKSVSEEAPVPVPVPPQMTAASTLPAAEPAVPPDDTANLPTGLLCVAPLDFSPTPGKGSMSGEPWGDDPWGGEDNYPAERRHRTVTVTVNGSVQTIDLTHGAAFSGLALDETHDVALFEQKAARPYSRLQVNFAKEQAVALCIFDNGFYGTTQISDIPRRPFCRKCFKNLQSSKR